MITAYPTVYIAGPYTAPTPEGVAQNGARAQALGRSLLEAALAKGVNLVPVVPHSLDAGFGGLGSAEYWYAATASVLIACDYVLLTPDWQDSKGALAEVEIAGDYAVPVFATIDELLDGLKSSIAQRIPSPASSQVLKAKQEITLDQARELAQHWASRREQGRTPEFTPAQFDQLLAWLRQRMGEAMGTGPATTQRKAIVAVGLSQELGIGAAGQALCELAGWT
jgi:hypothetical protein